MVKLGYEEYSKFNSCFRLLVQKPITLVQKALLLRRIVSFTDLELSAALLPRLYHRKRTFWEVNHIMTDWAEEAWVNCCLLPKELRILVFRKDILKKSSRLRHCPFILIAACYKADTTLFLGVILQRRYKINAGAWRAWVIMQLPVASHKIWRHRWFEKSHSLKSIT